MPSIVMHAQGDDPQAWLLPPPGIDRLPDIPLSEPTHLEKLASESELLGFAVSGHPLDWFPDVAWHTYSRVSDLGRHIGQKVVTWAEDFL